MRQLVEIGNELAAFEAGERDASNFPHSEHVRIAFEMTARYGFDDALARYASGLRRMSARAGQIEKYHMTITVAFLALVAQQRITSEASTWSEFSSRNSMLFEVGCLERWYDPALLNSPLARRTFVLPEPRGLVPCK
jgi:hypothetical protein